MAVIDSATMTATQRASWTKYNAMVTALTDVNIIDSSGNLTIFTSAEAVADDGTISLPDASYGLLIAMWGTDWLVTNIAGGGTVTRMLDKGSTAYTDSDGYFCVYDNGTQAIVKNRTGASVNVALIYIYFTP